MNTVRYKPICLPVDNINYTSPGVTALVSDVPKGAYTLPLTHPEVTDAYVRNVRKSVDEEARKRKPRNNWVIWVALILLALIVIGLIWDHYERNKRNNS